MQLYICPIAIRWRLAYTVMGIIPTKFIKKNLQDVEYY